MQKIKGLSILLMGLGFLSLIGSALSFISAHALVQSSGKAMGEIIDVVTKTSAQGDDVYYPRIRFTTSRDQLVEFVSAVGTNSHIYHPGDQLRVLYNVQSPAHAKIYDFLNLWSVPLVFLGVGGIALMIGFILLGITTNAKKMGRSLDER